ncbi:hypothetical protein BH18ACI2_BH18ACI2_12910 [soil metagenome]
MPSRLEANRRKKQPKQLSKQPLKDARLSQIYHTAAGIIYRQGYEATSLSEIAKAAGLTKAGLYHYIPSKEHLLFEIMNYGMNLVDSDVITPARAVADPQVRLRTIVTAYANLIMEERQPITIMINEAKGLTPARQRKVRARRRVFYEFVRDTIQEIKDEGEVAVLDVGMTAISFVGVLVWLAYWYHPEGRLTKQQVIDEIVELMVERMVGIDLPAVRSSDKRRLAAAWNH